MNDSPKYPQMLLLGFTKEETFSIFFANKHGNAERMQWHIKTKFTEQIGSFMKDD